jgi:hypothetical protein
MKILSIKAVFSKGLNENIVSVFPSVKSIIKPEFNSSFEKLNPY